MTISHRLQKALGNGAAETRPDSSDPRFRGRTYAIPFEDVWQACLSIIREDLRGCTVRLANDRDGIIIAEAHTRLPPRIDDVTVSVVLDKDAQTRVDMRSITRDGGRDLGANTRRIARFFELLDQKLPEVTRRRAASARARSASASASPGS